jgi:hypothetical protein
MQQLKTVKILLCVLSLLCSGLAIAESLKEINFHGGIIKFKIPSNWKEEYGENGKGAFYEEALDTGTLRLKVLTMEAPPDAKGNLSVLALSSLPDIDINNIEILDNGNALAHEVDRADEQGTKFTLYWWHLANYVPPNYVRMASYSYAILTSKESDRKTKEEIELLERQIKNAVFNPELGE